MPYAGHVIQRFGGARPLARRLKLPPTTVQTWKDTDHIPAQRLMDVFEAGRDLDPPLSPCEFFGLPPKHDDGRKNRHRAGR